MIIALLALLGVPLWLSLDGWLPGCGAGMRASNCLAYSRRRYGGIGYVPRVSQLIRR
jgi:hypothetical protein